MERANKFIMVERVVGTGIDEAYGVARTVMKKIGHDGIIPVLEVDNVRTAEGLKAAGVEGTYVFVAPDSMEAVKQRLTDEIKASCPEGYGPGELHSVEEAVDLRLATSRRRSSWPTPGGRCSSSGWRTTSRRRATPS